MHQRRERHWLARKAKHRYIDFSDSERVELRRYFDALAGSNSKVGLDQLENMMISLGLADTRKEVAAIVEKIDDEGSGELDFEQYLELVRTRTDSNILRVFNDMMEGKLGDRNLNFQTVISTYRRKLILDAAGARSTKGEQQELGRRVLHNFAALQRSRHAEARAASAADAQEDRGTDSGGNEDDEEPVRLTHKLPPVAASDEPSFVVRGHAPLGGLEMVWLGVCHEHSLVSPRPASADGRSKRTLERPPSPRTVVESIVQVRRKKRLGGAGATVIIVAPELEDDVGRHVSKEG